MRSATVPSAPIMGNEKKLTVRVAAGPTVHFAALVAAGAIFAGASGPTYASVLDPGRLNGGSSSTVVVARQEDCFSLADIMAELKLKTGLTWDQLGNLFQVSRRTIHSWAKGSEIKSSHRERVERLLDRVRELKALRPFELRRLLAAEANDALPVVQSWEPAILVGDQRPSSSKLKVAKATRLSIVRRDSANG